MITTATEFAETTAFERHVLDRLKPVIAESGSDAIDLRHAIAGCGPVTINISLYCSLSEQTRQASIIETLPLLFGAAWKILDLTIELALSVSGEKPSKQNNWRISEKTSKATTGIVPLSLLTNALPLWRALCAIYQATAEHCHCMVHRQASFSGTPLALHGHVNWATLVSRLEDFPTELTCVDLLALPDYLEHQ